MRSSIGVASNWSTISYPRRQSTIAAACTPCTATAIEAEALGLLGFGGALEAPRSTLGAPWNKDHRIAFAAAIVADRRSG